MLEHVINKCYQLAYKVGYPLALLASRTKTYRHDGVTIALWHQDLILMVKHSYRAGILLPGGGAKFGEDLRECLAREIKEEVGIIIAIDKLRLIETRPRIHAVGEVHLFEMDIDEMPAIKIDNREIIFADFIHISNVNTDIHDSMMRDYLIAKKNLFMNRHILT